MGDAVVRVQAHLREIARDNWEALEDRHARDLTWLRAELEQVARALDVRGVALDVKRPTPAPFVSDYRLPRPHKKRKLSAVARVSANETRTGAGVETEPAADHNTTEGAVLSTAPISSTRDRTEDKATAVPDAVQNHPFATDSEHDEAQQNQSEVFQEGDKRRSRKRGRPHASEADPLHMRVIDLRMELRRRGLKVTGNKPELLSRLLNYMTASPAKRGYRTEARAEEAAGSCPEDSSDADAGRSERFAFESSAFRRESDSSAHHTDAKGSSSHEVETNATATLTDTAQTAVGDATEAESGADDNDGRSSGVSKSGRLLQAKVVRPSIASKKTDANKRSTSSETGLKVVPTSSTSSRRDSSETSAANLRSDESSHEEGTADTLPLNIEANAARNHPSALQDESRMTPRDQIVPSSYASNVEESDEVRRDSSQHHEDETGGAESMASLRDTTPSEAVVAASPAPGSVSWLHSRAKEAIKAFTERRIDTSASNTSLLARGFRALQDAIVPESMPETSQATSEHQNQSANEVSSARVESTTDPDSTPRPSLRSTASLPSTDRQPLHKVTFSGNDAVSTITEEPTTDNSAIEGVETSTGTDFGAASESDKFTNVRVRSVSLPKAELSQDSVYTLATTPDSSQSSTSSKGGAEKAKSAEADKSDEARRQREFQESVDREAQRLRQAAKLSAQKRFEEAKATKAYWERREQLKLQMQSEASTHAINEGAVVSNASASASKGAVPTEALVESASKQVTTQAITPSSSATTSTTPDVDADNVPNLNGAVTATQPPASSSSRPRADSMSSTVSSVSSSSGSTKAVPSSSATAKSKRALPNLVSGVHSFTFLIDSNKEALPSSSARSVPVVNSLKLAERTRQLEEKKRDEKIKRKEALMKKYEEQRKLDEKKKEDDKRKREAQKEKAEREAKLKREQERIEAKKKREQELAHKRHEKLMELKMRAAKVAAEKERSEKEKARATEQMAAKAPAASSSAHANGASQLVPPPRPTKPRPAKLVHPSSSKPKPDEPPKTTSAPASSSSAAAPSTAANKQPNAETQAEPASSYDMSDQGDSESDGISEDDDDESKSKRRRRDGKDIPAWAQRENLDKALRAQFGPNAIDPTPAIFPDFADTCDLEAIFDSSDARRKKRFGRRTSSGNWFGDRPSARDRALYRRDMGFSR